MDKDPTEKESTETSAAGPTAEKGSTGETGEPKQATGSGNGKPSDKTWRDVFEEAAYGTKREEEESGPRHPLDLLFSEANRVPELHGEPCDIPELPKAEREFLKARCLVISGHDPKELCWASTCLSDRAAFSFRYLTDSLGIAGLTWIEIVRALAGRDAPTCLILSCATYDAHRNFAASISAFSEAVKYLLTTPHGLIVYVHPQAVRKIETSGWRENVPLLEIPDRRVEQTSAKQVDPSQVVRDIFAPSASTPQELFAAQNRLLIPRVLLRVAVLFPNLSTINFDSLLKPILQGQRVEVTPARRNAEAKEADAWDLWTIGRQTYEQQVGLMRETTGAGTSMRFVSKEAEENANAWVWRYPEDLLSLFAAVSSRRILFGDYLGDDEEELFSSYVHATVNLAHRAPGLFGARWLETLFHDFSGWVQDNTTDLGTPAHDLFLFLAQLENQEKRGWFWSRFAERIAMLAGLLYRDRSEKVVDQFFDRLARQDLGELVLQILRRMGNAVPNEKRLEWIERMAKNNDSVIRAAAVKEMAWQILWHPDAASAFLPKLRSWLDRRDQEKLSPIFNAAVALPAFLFDAAARKSIDSTREDSPLLASLRWAAEDGQTVKDYCQIALANEEFGRIAGDFLHSQHMTAEEEPAFAVALAVYQSALALPDSEHAIPIEFLESAFQPLSLRGQNAVRHWWKEFAEQCRTMKASIPSDSPDRSRHRESLNRRCEIARMLIQH
ncbi:MAG TPA: hypothetical protein VGW57_08840 [Chthoniobacterales bacterium]|nr:hypothetical protein [Chthoniobacterales bacterium]